MVRQRYIGGPVMAKNQTEKAFLCSFDWSEQHGYAASDMWVPLSVIDEDCHTEIEEAVKGEVIDLYIASWWLEKQF